MDREDLTIENLASQQIIVVDYSDDDIIIIDNVKQLAEPNPTRLRMNLIAVAKKGKSQMSLNGQRVTFAENDLLLCPPNTVLNDMMFSPDFEFMAVFLTSNMIQSFLREKVNIWNEMMYIHKMHVVRMEDDDVEYFYHFYEALRLTIKNTGDRYPYRTECIQELLRSAILGLCGALLTVIPSEVKTTRTQGDTLFQRFLNLVYKDETKSRTVEDFASELCVSSKYLSVVCKRTSGKTANEWIREHILEEIRYYLKQTDLPMKQIADKLGFANPSFFGKYVKEHFGMTPMQYRQK